MARLRDVFLEIHSTIIESRAGLRLRDAEALAQDLLVPRDAHAAPAAAGRSLHDHRETDLASDADGLVDVGQDAVAAGHHGQAGRLHRALGLGLVAHAPYHLGIRADER